PRGVSPRCRPAAGGQCAAGPAAGAMTVVAGSPGRRFAAGAVWHECHGCPATTRASGPLRPFKGWESWTSSGPGGCRPAWGTRDRPGRCRPLQPAPRKLEGSGGLLLAVAVVLLARAFQQGLAHAV